MPVSYTNGAIKVRDKDGNYVQFRGGSDDDWEKIRLALEELGYLKEDVQSLKEYILAGGGTGGGSGVVDVDDASNTRKGITYLTDDPNANKNAATGVTAVTPKALQAAIDKLKEQIISGEITPPEPEPEPEPEPDPELTINTPTVTVTGAPSNVPLTPTITVSAFSGTDTFKTTHWKVVKVSEARVEETVWEASSATTSVTVPQGKLVRQTNYKFMARYEGVKGTFSAWAETSATTLERIVDPNDIGRPGEPNFGVGVAPEEVYESLGLKPLPGTEDPESFQYGLYEATAPNDEDDTHIQTYHAYLKYIPKCYHCFLSTDDETLMDEGQLQELEQYTGLTVAQMQEAQRRGGTSAIALAPASAFENEADANAHGFILNRGYYDDGKEKPGFFIANTLTSYFQSSDAAGNTEIQYYCGAPSFQFEPAYKYSETQEKGMSRLNGDTPQKLFGIHPGAQGAIDLAHKFTGCNCMSMGQWQVVCMIAYAAGLYCKDNTQCAWWANGYNACPNGINTGGSKDDRDATVTCSPTISGTAGTVWVPDGVYPKTTHNGRINGITNCNGWLYQIVLGADSSWRMASLSMRLALVANGFKELEHNPFTDISGQALVGNWGASGGSSNFQQPIARTATHDAKWAAAFAFPVNSNNNTNASTQFGNDYVNRIQGCVIFVGGSWYSGANAGLFFRGNMGNIIQWTGGDAGGGVRIGGYPEV